jgi:hypothetical protein
MKLKSSSVAKSVVAVSCLPPALISPKRTARSKQRQVAPSSAYCSETSTPNRAASLLPTASKPSALTIWPIGFMMARSPHVSIGCYDSHGSHGSQGSVLLHHRRRETVDKTCSLPRSLRCSPLSTVTKCARASHLLVVFPSVFLLLYD